MWLSKGLNFMLPEMIVYALVTAVGVVVQIPAAYYLFMPGMNFLQIASAIFGNFLYASPTMSTVPVILCFLFYALLHMTALLFIYRYFWLKWGAEKDIGRVTMSADAYGNYDHSDNSAK